MNLTIIEHSDHTTVAEAPAQMIGEVCGPSNPVSNLKGISLSLPLSFISFLIGPHQANLCLRAFRHDKFQLRMPSHSEGSGIWLSV